MAQKNFVKLSVTIVKIASWLMLAVFIIAGVTNGITVFQGSPDIGEVPKWAAPVVLAVLWGVGLFVFALYYLIGSAVELLVEIRDNTKRS